MSVLIQCLRTVRGEVSLVTASQFSPGFACSSHTGEYRALTLTSFYNLRDWSSRIDRPTSVNQRWRGGKGMNSLQFSVCVCKSRKGTYRISFHVRTASIGYTPNVVPLQAFPEMSSSSCPAFWFPGSKSHQAMFPQEYNSSSTIKTLSDSERQFLETLRFWLGLQHGSQ